MVLAHKVFKWCTVVAAQRLENLAVKGSSPPVPFFSFSYFLKIANADGPRVYYVLSQQQCSRLVRNCAPFILPFLKLLGVLNLVHQECASILMLCEKLKMDVYKVRSLWRNIPNKRRKKT